ncbi:MAG: NADH-quinone oxidoreductase subunit L [Firmicutes bacterium]|nr:NADH-quinone oxidoreductase subunit L [Bacillota bacterium]
MGSQWIILACIFVPLLGSFLLPVIGRINANARNLSALLLVLVSLICSVLSLHPALTGQPLRIWLELPQGLSLGFLGDGMAVLAALTFSLCAAVIIFFSFGYIERYDNQNEYYFMVTLFMGAVMGTVFATNLILIYAFWEITSVCCWRLLGFDRSVSSVRLAGKALLVNVFCSLLMLGGFISIYMQMGTFNLLDMQGRGVDNWLMAMMLIGILAKSAVLPLHSWLSSASGAPASVSALIGGSVMVNLGVYIYARLFLAGFQLEPVWTVVTPAIAAVSALVAAGAALRETDIKRILSCSAVCQTSFILMGVSCGTMIGAAGGLIYILMNALATGGLFLCAGMIECSTGVRDIRELGGLAKNMPLTAVAFGLCALSVMGLPPFGGFFAKYMLIAGAVQSGHTWLALLFAAAALMTVIYLLRVFTEVFFGPLINHEAAEGSWEMVVSMLLLGGLSLISGIFISIPSDVAVYVAESLGRW